MLTVTEAPEHKLRTPPARPVTIKDVTKFKPRLTRYETPDALVPGLRLVTYPTGTQSWIVRYTLNKKYEKHTLDVPASDILTARDKAREALRLVEKGVAPSGAKRGKDASGKLLPAPMGVDDGTMAWAARRFDAEHIERLRPGTAAYYRREMGRVLDAWAKRDRNTITRKEVAALVKRAADERGDGAANSLLKVIATFYKFCLAEAIADVNPAAGLRRRSTEDRERTLTDAEVVEIWRAAVAETTGVGRMTRLLLLTGCRRNEIGALTWDEVTDDAIALSRARTKTKQALTIPITPEMRRVLDECPRTGRYVCNGKDNPIGGGDQAKSKIKAHVEGWTFHDFRRTMVSGMAALQIDEVVADRCLNHKVGTRISRIYQRHDFAKPMADAWRRWNDHVARIVDRMAKAA